MRMAADACRGVEEALFAAARSLASAGDTGLVRGCAEALEVMRVEAGIPSLEAELDDGVLPPEARLERAISTSKGCYVGQEIVARLRARGQVNHLLVGLRIESGALPEIGSKLQASGRDIGEITSVARSPAEGAIALGYVRREHSEAGTRLDSASGAVRVTALPFVAPAPVRGADA
jgi:folate-binding protein YgfZ